MKLIKGAKKIGKELLALVLCLSVLLCGIPTLSASAKEAQKSYTRLYDYDELAQRYLSEDEQAQAEYPNGAFMFPLSSSQLKQNELYAIEVFREGGTKGEASITVKSVDMTAQYGVDYEIFLDNKRFSSPVDGEANPYYDMEEYSFIATHTQSETVYASNNDENTQQVRDEASDYNDYVLDEVMPTSSEFTLDFADGENSKTIYIQTYQKDEVTANLEFTLNLCNPQGGSIGVQTGCAFTILEEREIPPTYLELVEGSVNPDSEEAYITVKRSGNMCTQGSFTIRTESATAKADTAYQAVQMPIDFTPGMSEIKVPVTMLDKAENGTYFNACLEDITVADSKNQVKKMNITDKVKAESRHETTFTASQQYAGTSAMVNPDTGTRGVQIIDASKFDVSTVTDRGTGSQSHGYKADGSDMKLEYDNNWSSKNNCISVRSKEKINFTGVDSITIAIDILGGSTKSDDQLFYVSDNDKFSSNTSNYDWVHSLSGIGGCWDMTNISDSFLQRTANLDQSKVKGEHYLYLALHKGAVVGKAGYKVYNRGTGTIDHNLRLNMTKYNLSIIEPASTKIYVDGTLSSEQVAKNVKLVDPAATHGSDQNKGVSFDIYRDETSAISAAIDSKFNGLAKLDGVYFCESGKTSNHSELYKLSSDSFTLTSEILEKYSSYIKDKKIVIQPVYSVSNSNLKVESFENTKTGQKFVADNKNCKGEFYYSDEHIGTLSWTKPRSDTNNYLVADTLKFSFEYADGVSSKLWNVKFDTRAASTESLLSTADIITKDTGTLSANIQLSDLYFSVTPKFCLADTTTVLNVTNPQNGDFIGKGGKYATSNSDGSVTIKGYSAQDGATDTVLNDMSVNEIITFHAQPNSGYRAKWSYTDSASHATKTYYGNSFFFAIQNPYNIDDNHITLTFEKTGSDYKTFNFYGQTLMQEGSIINPPTSETDTYNLVGGAQITMDSYSALSDSNGEFHLETNPGNDDSQLVKISASKDEIHRALVFYNNRYYICDINMGDYLSTDNVSSITAKLKMQYKTNGVTPTRINSVSADGTVYGDTITLITANAVQFDLSLDTKGQSADKPVNLVRWSVENEDGIKSKYDVALEKGQTVSHWANTLSEIIKQGDKLYVELLWKGYDDSANEIYSSYGKFDTGYNFVATSITDTITYAPDIGAPEVSNGPETLVQPVPVLGNVSPTFSIKGFTPIINTGTAGVDSDGHEIHTITVGLSYGKVKDAAVKDSDWGTISPLDKAKKLVSVLDAYDEALNSESGVPKHGIGKELANSLNMKTSVRLSFRVTFCYQGNYYVDDDGNWMFVGNLLIAGAGGTIRVSMPFVLCYIPCFAYFTASIDMNMYVGIFPHTDGEVGSTVALTLDQLSYAGVSDFQGVYELKIGLGVGVGVGFDGLLSASGGVDFKFDIQFNNFLRGVGNVGMSGSITLELLFLKASWSDNFFTAEMFNTLEDSNDIVNLSKVQSQIETDLLKNTTIGDMVVSTGEASNIRLATNGLTQEKVIEATDTLVNPEIISIGNDRYLVVSMSTDNSTDMDNVLHFYIYDEPSNSVVDSGAVLKRAIEDAMREGPSNDVSRLNDDYNKIDHDVVMADCGDDILIAWNKCTISKHSDVSELLNSVGIATIYYNKESGKFHDYRVISDKTKEHLYMTPKLVYNSKSDSVQLFYQAMNAKNITLDTTLEEIQSMPTVLLTSYSSADGGDWSNGEPVSINGKYLKYFDATSYADETLLSYVASDTQGFTLDSVENFEVESDFDASKFETNNSLYIQSFEMSDGKPKASNPMRITKDGYVTANPKFINISTQGVENTLLFYRCNGAYAYQNITNILTNGLYTNMDGYSQISEAYVEPQFISETEDYTTNDDFSVFTNGSGDIYALWTTTESNQQQIWVRQFVFNSFDKITEVGKLDSNGLVICDGNSNPVTEKLDNPIYLLNGYWGGKTYLTEDGIYGSDNFGMYKDDFSAVVLDNGDLLTAFNAYDREITEDGCKFVNNMLVISEYNTDSEYHMPKVIDAIEFSNEYPTGGETVNVTCHAENLGVNSGRDVTVTLFVNGNAYDSITESVWLSAEAKTFDFYYTLPQNQRADDVSMYFTVTENGEQKLVSDSYALKYGVDLEITGLTLSENNLITKDNDKANFFVRATVQNKGNVDYAGGDYVRLVDFDVEEMCASMEDGYKSGKAIYTSFGREQINSIEVGNTTEVCFISQDIPSKVFEKTGTDTAYLECIISQKNEADWKTRNSEQEFSSLSEFYPGLTTKPVPKTAKSLSISDMTVGVNNPQQLNKSVQPVSALINSKISYSSSDESVATVDDFGVVTGHKKGTAVITAEIDGISDEAKVTVSNKPVPTEESGDGSSTDSPDSAKPSDSKNDSSHSSGGAGAVQTGVIIATVVILIMIASAVAVIFLRKRRNKIR